MKGRYNMNTTLVKKAVKEQLHGWTNKEKIVDWDIDPETKSFGSFYVSVITISKHHQVWKHTMWVDETDYNMITNYKVKILTTM